MTRNLFFAILQYLISTVRHKAYVFYAGVFIVGDIPIWRLLVHDWTKFNPVEFVNYARFYKMENGRNNRDAFLKAWVHHQKHNKHHPEYWVSFGVFEWSNRSLLMPKTFVREWVVDLLGASREYTKSWNMNDWVKANIDRWNYCDVGTLVRYCDILQEIGVSVKYNKKDKTLYYVLEEKLDD